MAQTKQMTVPQLKELISNYIATNKIASTSFEVTRDNTAGLVDKIGKIFTNDQMFIDKLAEFDGEFLSYGKTVEEWQIDLCLAYDDSEIEDVDSLKSHYANYRKPEYSYELGQASFIVSRKYNDLQKAVANEGQLSELVYAISRSLTNSVIVARYASKRQLAGKLADAAFEAMSDTGAELFVISTAFSNGTKVKNTDTGTAWGIIVKDYPGDSSVKDWSDAVEKGYIVVYDTKKVIAKPTDTTTGEAFLKQVKADIEIGSDVSQGHSLNGNTLGSTSGMVLLVKQGVIPSLEVDTYAGAFQSNALAVPAKMIVVPDFGKMDNDNVYAMLVDSRAFRLFPTFDYSGATENTVKGFVNYSRIVDYTAHYSRNTFVKVYSAE